MDNDLAITLYRSKPTLSLHLPTINPKTNHMSTDYHESHSESGPYAFAGPVLEGGYINLDMVQQKFEGDFGPAATRRTKIVCTLGPASWSNDGISTLLDSGMNVARLNFSHGDHAGHQAVYGRLRAVADSKNRNLASTLLLFSCCLCVSSWLWFDGFLLIVVSAAAVST